VRLPSYRREVFSLHKTARTGTKRTSIGIGTAFAMLAALVVPLSGTALASHVGTVTITPPVGIEATGVCSPFLVTTSGGTDPVGARVDVEVIGTSPIQFCLPAAGLNPVLIDPATGDLGTGWSKLTGTSVEKP